jgi:muconolactone delta-isomerase
MQKFMVDILLQDLDNETRMRLLPAEQAMVKAWEENGTLLASYIKRDIAGIYLVMLAQDAQDVDAKLATLPYYPYMKIAITPLRVASSLPRPTAQH